MGRALVVVLEVYLDEYAQEIGILEHIGTDLRKGWSLTSMRYRGSDPGSWLIGYHPVRPCQNGTMSSCLERLG